MNSAPAAVVAPPALVVSAVVLAVLAVVGVPLVLGVVLGVVAGVLLAVWLWLGAPQSALRTLGAQPLGKGDHPRLENVVAGVCTTHGFSRPALHIVETDAINVAAVGLGRPGHLVVTRGALSGLDRLEIEAVVARQLFEIRRGVSLVTVLASAARVPGTGWLAARRAALTRGFDRVVEVDLESVRLTGFPPALASALKKSAQAGGVDVSAATHLWLVTPGETASAARGRPSIDQRIDVLGEI